MKTKNTILWHVNAAPRGAILDMLVHCPQGLGTSKHRQSNSPLIHHSEGNNPKATFRRQHSEGNIPKATVEGKGVLWRGEVFCGGCVWEDEWNHRCQDHHRRHSTRNDRPRRSTNSIARTSTTRQSEQQLSTHCGGDEWNHRCQDRHPHSVWIVVARIA